MFRHKFTHLHTQNPPYTIHEAVASKDNQAVINLLANGVDPNLLDKDGNTPLHLFAYHISDEDSVSIAKSPLEQGAESTIPNKEKDISLHTIALDDSTVNIAIAKILLENGADPNLQNKKGETPLHIIAEGYDLCAEEDFLAMTKLLLEKGANPNLQNQEGKTPLYIAVSQGDTGIVDILLASEKTKVNLPDNLGRTPLFGAVVDFPDVFCTVEGIMRALLAQGATPNSSDQCRNTPLHIAAWKGCLDTIKMLIECGAEVNVQNEAGETPLCIAVMMGESEIVGYLIDKGADVNVESQGGYTPFYLAATGLSRYEPRTQPQNRSLLDMVKIFLDKKENALDWKDEDYRKKLLEDARDEEIKELLNPIFQRVAMWELWTMKTAGHNSYLQWLPHELVENIQWSFFSREYILKRKRIAEEEHESRKQFCQGLVSVP